MKLPQLPRWTLVAGSLPIVLGIAGCWGDDDDAPAPIPQLGAATASTYTGACSDLTSRLSFANTTFAAVTTVAAGTVSVGGTPVAEHCLVTGSMFQRNSAVDNQSYAIGFEMRLPRAWNGRYYYQANGGTDGSVVTALGTLSNGPLTGALSQGFAVISSNAGHTSAQNASFGIDPQARLDYGYQAVAKLTPMAKAVIASAYGRGPDRSYIGGCSNGGRHTMVAASRYADQYDGFLVGDPGFNLPKAALANIAGAQAYNALSDAPGTATAANLGTAFALAERTTVSNAVLAKCDALDGTADGLVQDTTGCQTAFNLARDVPTCTGARNGTCLTNAQKAAIAQLFAGAKTGSGTTIYTSFPYDAGLGTSNYTFWKFTVPLVLDSVSVGTIFQTPPENLATFNGPAFSLGANLDTVLAKINATNAVYTESSLSFMTPPHPTDLSVLKNRGAKMMIYHGTSDPIFSSDDTTAFYENLRAANGGDAGNFARFFRVPGMNHCAGGPATDQFDMLTPLVDWVEKGAAPASVVASARGTGNAGGVNADVPTTWSASRTRPLCPYPQVAKYKGSGSIEDAASFACQ